MSEVNGSSLKTITGFILYVYRFPNMLAENKNPTAYGTDGEYRTQHTKFEHRESSIKNPESSREDSAPANTLASAPPSIRSPYCVRHIARASAPHLFSHYILTTKHSKRYSAWLSIGSNVAPLTSTRQNERGKPSRKCLPPLSVFSCENKRGPYPANQHRP